MATLSNLIVTQAGNLTIQNNSLADIPMVSLGWVVTDLSPLWFYGQMRGQNPRMYGVAGSVGYRKVLDEQTVTIPIVFSGDYNRSNTPLAVPNAYAGLEYNINDFTNTLFLPPNTTAGTRLAKLTMPSGAVRTASVQLNNFQQVNKGPAWIATTVDVIIIGGRFT
jgi:ABC-type uncharacterized transport system permease subunit